MADGLEGGCLCGAVRYRADGVDPNVTECHCGQCRRQSGHRYASVNARPDGVEIEGADRITWFSASDFAERGFCSRCGSHLFWKTADGKYLVLLAASVDEPNALKLAKHIFVDDKPGYYDIDDGLPRFEGYDRPVGG